MLFRSITAGGKKKPPTLVRPIAYWLVRPIVQGVSFVTTYYEHQYVSDAGR